MIRILTGFWGPRLQVKAKYLKVLIPFFVPQKGEWWTVYCVPQVLAAVGSILGNLDESGGGALGIESLASDGAQKGWKWLKYFPDFVMF